MVFKRLETFVEIRYHHVELLLLDGMLTRVLAQYAVSSGRNGGVYQVNPHVDLVPLV